MAGPLDPLAYTAAQGARVGWFLSQYYLSARLSRDALPNARVTGRRPGTREFLREMAALFRQDWRNIADRHYGMPDDLVPRPRQLARVSAAYFRDLPTVNARRKGRANGEVVSRPPVGSERLPRYYRQNFHFQTDGYLSDHSARLYDYQVEVLFAGAADAMRRQALVPVSEHLRQSAIRDGTLVDVATGTGRFLDMVRRNYRHLRLVGIDLSHAYLSEARRRTRSDPRAGFALAGAEALPLPDAMADLISCVYLFHELPPKLRPVVVAEMARVLKPGGRLVFLDSLQHGDRPDLDGLLEYFPHAFHEPYYDSFIRQDMGGLFADAGLRVVKVQPVFLSKLFVVERSRG